MFARTLVRTGHAPRARSASVESSLVAYRVQARTADYNEMRTHLGLSKDAPLPRAVQRSGAVVTVPILSGLHHHYART